MHHIHFLLRRAFVEQRMQGSLEGRDAAIEMFLEELGELFTPRLIETIPDETLAEMFEDWVKALEHLDREQRIAALVADVRLCRIPFLIYRKGYAAAREAPPAPAGNVVPLHRS